MPYLIWSVPCGDGRWIWRIRSRHDIVCESFKTYASEQGAIVAAREFAANLQRRGAQTRRGA